MEYSRLFATPMMTRHKLLKNDDSTEVNQTLYRSMIGKPMYVVHSRPYIAHVVGIVANFFANPKESYMASVKRIMRYLKNIENYGLWYKKQGNFELQVYTDADWAWNINDWKSTTSGAFFFGERLVTWISNKQACISQSTTEA